MREVEQILRFGKRGNFFGATSGGGWLKEFKRTIRENRDV